MGNNSKLHRRVGFSIFIVRYSTSHTPSTYDEIDWSVLMRRLKTPPNDYYHCVHGTNLNCAAPWPSDRYTKSIKNLTRSSYGPSQADVASFKALPGPPRVEKYPHAWLVVRSSIPSVITCLGAGTNTYLPTNQVPFYEKHALR